MAGRRYSLQEANALLPHLAPTLIELQDKFEEAADIKVKIVQSAPTNGGSAKRERWLRILARVAELMDRLNEWDIKLRDISTGLVDLPTSIGGRDAYFCWKLGEPEIAHWHSPDDGFKGRRKLR